MTTLGMPTAQPRWRDELRATLRLALPLMVGQLSAIGMNVIDTVLAGHYNAQTMAAVAVGTNVWALALIATIGIMMALPASVAQLVGAGEKARVGELFRQGLWLALGFGLLMLIAVRNAEPLLRLMRIDPALVADTLKFLRAISWGAPALAGYFALRGLSEGMALTRPTMYFGFLGLVLLGPIGYTLMYGAFGLPALGAEGSGMATAIVLWLQFGAFALYVATRRHYRAAAPFARFDPPRWAPIGALLSLGVQMGTALMMEGGLFVSAALLLGSLGATVVDGHQIAVNFASATFMLPLALAMATTVRVGHAAGAGQMSSAYFAGYVGIGASLGTALLSCAVMALLPHVIAGLYTNDTAVAGLAAHLLLFAAVFQFSDGIQATANGALRGLKDTTVPMLLTLLAYWGVGMPLGWGLCFRAGLGAPGMWIGLIGGLTAAAALLLARFAHLARRARLHAAT